MAASPQAPRRTSLGRRLFLSLLTMLVPLALLAGAALYLQYGSTVERDRIERETVEEFATISSARDAAERLRIETKAVRAAPRAHTIGRAAEARAALSSAVDRLQRQVNDDTERAAVRKVARAARRGDVEGVENALTGVRNSSLEELARRGEGLRDGERRLLAALVILLLASAATAVILANRVRNHIAGPLHQLRDAARRIGGDDLSRHVHVGGDDELHEVAEAFNGMMDRLVQGRDELVHQAFHDALTGLPNRALFRDRTQHALARAYTGRRESPGRIAVLFCDLDDFKSINDSLGHSAGDQLLRQVGGRLSTTLRLEDSIARLGGDEFAILIEDVPDPKAAEATAKRILKALTMPIRLPQLDRDVVTRASIGIALSTGPDDSAEDLLRDADAAMYAAKNGGRNRYRVFEADMHERALERFALEAELRRALDRNEFRLEYQPVLELATHDVVAVEALVRWEHPTKGTIMPNDFIPTAEETGLIVPLGRWVLEAACRCAKTLQGTGDLVMSVNLSPRQFHDPNLVGDVAHAVDVAGIDARTLVLEITESMLTADLDATAEETGLIVPLGRWVLESACRCAKTLQSERPIVMSVNLSPRQFHDPNLVSDVAQAVDSAGIDARTLVLEITESMLTSDLDTTAETLADLKELGVRLAIDDFGTGFSTLSYLRRFPIDILKLDRELIAAEGPDAKLTKAMIGLGQTLELATVAEGIERPEQEEELRALGCELGQGFLFARPMCEDDLVRELADPQRLVTRSRTADPTGAPLSAVPRSEIR